MTQRATVCALLRLTVLGVLTVSAFAQTSSGRKPARAAAPAGVEQRVRIVATTQPEDSSSIDIGSDHWIALGYDLRALIAEIYAADLLRIDLPANIDPARYDVSLAFSEDTTEEQVQRLLQQALREKFRLIISPEARAVEVYVITAPNGPGPVLHPHRSRGVSTSATAAASADLELAPEDMPRFTIQGRICPGISSGGISATAGTISEFRRVFEPTLDRPLVNETNLTGSYDFQIAQYSSKEELFQLLRDQLGLVLTPSQRRITVLAVRSNEALPPQAGAL
jgi:uncharacterized protein (TIGR03435 family)